MNKKIIIISIAILLMIGGGIALFKVFKDNNSDNNYEADKYLEDEPIDVDEPEEEEEEQNRIRLSFNNEEAYVVLDDNTASRDFLSMLPLTVEVEDYNRTEKIATLPRELNVAGVDDSFTPVVGDFAYYVPWGNLSMFYNNFRLSNSLVKLGRFESGIELLENMNGNFEMTIEVVD